MPRPDPTPVPRLLLRVPVTFPRTGTTGLIDLYKRGCFVLEAKQGGGAPRQPPAQLPLLPDGRARRGRPAARPLGRRDDPRPRPGRGLRPRAPRRRPALPRHRRRRPRHRALRRLLPHRQELHPLPRRHPLPHPPRRPRATTPSASACASSGPTPRPRPRPHRRPRHPRDRRPPRRPRPLLRGAGPPPDKRRPLPDALPVLDVRRRRRPDPRGQLPRPADSRTRHARARRSHPLPPLWAAMDTGGFSPVLAPHCCSFNGGLFADTEALPVDNVQLVAAHRGRHRPTGARSSPRSSAPCSNAPSTRASATSSAPTTPRAPTSSAWSCPRSSSPCAPTGRTPAPPPSASPTTASEHGGPRQAARLPPPALRDPRPRPRLRLRQLPLRRPRSHEAPRRRGTDLLKEIGETQAALGLEGITVDPHQFLGIELNPRAAAVAELVLWIGYLQWHFRTHGRAAPSEPVLRDFHNIENRDAVLAWDATTPRIDADGRPVTRWDGTTTIRHPVTGEPVPDRTPASRSSTMPTPAPPRGPRPSSSSATRRSSATSACARPSATATPRPCGRAYPQVPQSADFVMYWWEKAALRARAWDPATRTGTRRFGLITTNSLRQTFNRRVVAPHLSDRKHPLSLLFAIPDHPWVEAGEGAAVRIAMTVGAAGGRDGLLLRSRPRPRPAMRYEGRAVTFHEARGTISADLTVGANVGDASALTANERLGQRRNATARDRASSSHRASGNVGLGRCGRRTHIRPYHEWPRHGPNPARR